jgi:hypothetical protein
MLCRDRSHAYDVHRRRVLVGSSRTAAAASLTSITSGSFRRSKCGAGATSATSWRRLAASKFARAAKGARDGRQLFLRASHFLTTATLNLPRQCYSLHPIRPRRAPLWRARSALEDAKRQNASIDAICAVGRRVSEVHWSRGACKLPVRVSVRLDSPAGCGKAIFTLSLERGSLVPPDGPRSRVLSRRAPCRGLRYRLRTMR